jgi:hypothetical protein
MDKPEITYQTATAADVDDILTIFAEVVPEVPTVGVIEGTKEMVQRLAGSGASSVALDADGKIVGYALAGGDGNGGIDLVYLGVTANILGLRFSKSRRSRLSSAGSQMVSRSRAIFSSWVFHASPLTGQVYIDRHN